MNWEACEWMLWSENLELMTWENSLWQGLADGLGEKGAHEKSGSLRGGRLGEGESKI